MSDIRQRILLTIISIDELRLICQGSSHCCRASPLLQLGFLVLTNMQANYWWDQMHCGPPNQNFEWAWPTAALPTLPTLQRPQ